MTTVASRGQADTLFVRHGLCGALLSTHKRSSEMFVEVMCKTGISTVWVLVVMFSKKQNKPQSVPMPVVMGVVL